MRLTHRTVGTSPGRAEIPLIGVGQSPGVKKQLAAIMRLTHRTVGTSPGRAEIPLIGVGQSPGVKKQLAAIMRLSHNCSLAVRTY